MHTVPAPEVLALEHTSDPTAADRLPCILSLLAIFILACGGYCFWYCHPLLIFSDQGLYMHMAKLLLQGKVPYLQMFEINPPLAIYLHVPPALAANLFHITEPLAFSSYIWILILMAGALSCVAVWRSGSRGALYIGLAAVFGLVYFSQGQVLDFGQRDHLFAILYFPFFIVRYLRWQGLKVDRWLAITAGTMGGFGIALKHYFVLVALAPEIVWTFDKRRPALLLTAEALTCASFMLLYLIHFLFLPKGEMDTFLNFIVPIYQAGYSYYMTSFSFNIMMSRTDVYQMIATTIGALIVARQSSFVLPLQAFSLMAALIFVLAGQVWTCHTVEMRMATDMAFFAQTVIFLGYLPAFLRRLTKFGPIFLSLLAVAFAGHCAYSVGAEAAELQNNGERFFVPSVNNFVLSPKDDIDQFSRLVLDLTDKNDTILFISSAMAPGYPVFSQVDRPPASRFLHGMILPMLNNLIDNTQPHSEFYRVQMKKVLSWYGEDIKANKPKLIFVQIRFVFDTLEHYNFYNLQMAGYKLLKEVHDYKVYIREK